MTAIMTLAVIAVVFFVWACLFWILPSALMGMFRNRLWRQRDALMAEIRKGAFQNPEQARWVARHIECYIHLAPQLSPLHIGLMRLSMIGTDLEDPEEPDLNALLPAERGLLEKRLDRFSSTLVSHVLFETPSGWLTVFVGIPIGLCVLLVRRIKRDGHGGTLSDGAKRRVTEGSSELINRKRVPVEPSTPAGFREPARMA